MLQLKSLVLQGCLALAIVFASFALAEEPDFNKRYSFRKATELAQASEREVMLFFWNVYCAACEKLKAEAFSDEAIRAKLSQDFVVAWVDTLNSANKDILKHYQVRGTPTVIFAKPDDGYPVEIVRTHSSSKEIFANVLDEAITILD